MKLEELKNEAKGYIAAGAFCAVVVSLASFVMLEYARQEVKCLIKEARGQRKSKDANEVQTINPS